MMKLPEQDGYYRFYDGINGKNIIVEFIINKIWKIRMIDPLDIKLNDEYGSYFLEPIEPIKFD